MTHSEKQIPYWEAAMRCGLIGGRPFSEPCVKTYVYYMTWFLKQYPELSLAHVKDVLLTVPVEHFAKRLKLYEAIRCFARYLIEQDEFDSVFLEKIRRFKPKRHKPPKKITVDTANIEKLLSVCDTPLDTMIVELLSQTGLRVTEACQLTLADVDLEKGCLTVRLAKWGKTRRVGLTQRIQLALVHYLTQRPKSVSQQLLVTAAGRPVERFGVRTRLEKLGRRVGVPVTPHALRRAFVTLNVNKGRPLVMLQIACGHSDIATTRSYCLTTEDEAIQAMQGWE
ncbi:tyrosine-type recombinase/integrase [Vampirovibrio sp.]|uniref:tyrosine-type recombinase/integrase n=1 Tax=Vampirovibrio sp. TaxID=2717857 RepID=UPI0035940666